MCSSADGSAASTAIPDTLGLFADARFLREVGAALAAPFRDARLDRVAGIEARGFVLAPLVAAEPRAGFVAIRKPGSIHPGEQVARESPPDWPGLTTTLRLSLLIDETTDDVRGKLEPCACRGVPGRGRRVESRT